MEVRQSELEDVEGGLIMAIALGVWAIGADLMLRSWGVI